MRWPAVSSRSQSILVCSSDFPKEWNWQLESCFQLSPNRVKIASKQWLLYIGKKYTQRSAQKHREYSLNFVFPGSDDPQFKYLGFLWSFSKLSAESVLLILSEMMNCGVALFGSWHWLSYIKEGLLQVLLLESSYNSFLIKGWNNRLHCSSN